jgi:hypothetical protein
MNPVDLCARWAKIGECEKNRAFMESSCRASCMVCESADCHDDHSNCGQWAGAGECSHNSDFMLKSCRYACRVCGINFKTGCRRDRAMTPQAVKGTIDATFRRAIERYPHYGARVLRREPWIVSFDNFLTPAEVGVLVRRAGHRFERSLAGDGVTPVRTSSTSWCNVPECLGDPVVQVRADGPMPCVCGRTRLASPPAARPREQAVRQRISNLTRVPWENAEHLQVLKYEAGEFYKEHHDQNSPRYSAWGPRLYTFFIYLSDVEAGGETRFTRLNMSVTPRSGSAILWPSVMSDDPYTTDERTYHEAVAVTRGVKYSANFWIHMYEFQQAPPASRSTLPRLPERSLRRAPAQALTRGCDNSDYFQDELLQTDLASVRRGSWNT